MYLVFFGIAEKPFAITPDPRYLYLGRHHADCFAQFYEFIASQIPAIAFLAKTSG